MSEEGKCLGSGDELGENGSDSDSTEFENQSSSNSLQNALDEHTESSEEDGEEEEKRISYGRVLASLQRIRVFHFQSPDFHISDEYEEELKKELEESLDDLMEIRAFTINHLQNKAEQPKKEKPSLTTPLKKIETLKVMSWDVGMLCYQFMGRRAEAIAELILNGGYDIVFLQELNFHAFAFLKCRLEGKYSAYMGTTRRTVSSFQDFNATFIKLDTVTVISDKVIYFERTAERRSLLRTEIKVGNAKICLLNTHLESMHRGSLLRRQQLQKCLSICQSVDSATHVIFSGSLNIRDWEINKLKTPRNLVDMWSEHGREDNKYTWNLRINQLIQMPVVLPGSGGQPRKRFGRMYLRPATKSMLKPCSFEVVGKEIVAAGKYSASDHWALVSTFSVDKNCYEKNEIVTDKRANEMSRLDLLPGEDEDDRAKAHEVKDNWDDSD